MDIFSFITLAGGLAFFLYGMNVMSLSLEKLAGGKLEGVLKRMTSNKTKSLALGAGITVAIQSSSAMTVMLVGLVNSGLMTLRQTIGVIMGSNIGTTLTAWILSSVGISSDNVFMSLLKPDNFSPIFALVGIAMYMFSKNSKKKDIGTIFVGFAVLMFGMNLMSGAVKPLADQPEFASLLTAFENPIVGVLVGTLFTGIIQSSAASVGILQGLALTGSITYGMAIPIIMGQNIGTCVTSLISSIGVNNNAKRVAAVHISFNIIGTVVFLIIYYGIDMVVHFTFSDNPINTVGIAAVHSIFNVLTTLMLLPFTNMLEKLAMFIVRDKNTEEEHSNEFLDSRLLATPSVAISECNNRTNDMAILAQSTILQAFNMIDNYDAQKYERILENEMELDSYEDKMGTLLVKLSSRALSDDDTQKISKMLHAIGDFERLGDHAVNLLKTAREIYEKSIHFSAPATKELNVLKDAINEILQLTIDAYINGDIDMAIQVEPLEQVIDTLIMETKAKHIERLQAGNCTIEMGFILSDLLINYERISDHCSNIAVAIIEVENNSFDTHQYLNGIKYGNTKFNDIYDLYSCKYSI